MRKTTQDFIKSAQKVHTNGHYSYENTVYVHGDIPCTISCKFHGEFEQIPYTHIRGSGCPKCGEILNYQKRFGGTQDIEEAKQILNFIYVLEFKNDKELFWKVGITHNINKRLSALDRKNSYNISILKLFEGSAYDNVTLEQQLLRKYKKFKYKPSEHFGGASECFKVNPLITFDELVEMSKK